MCFFQWCQQMKNTEHRVSQSFPQKAAQNLSRQKEAAGGFEPGTPVTFSGTSSNCRAVRGGGGGGGATEKPCVFDVSRGGLRGGLSSILS